MDASRLYAELDRRAAQISPQVIAWRHHVHQHPELSNREVHTARLIADHLKSLGLDEVRTGIAGHGVVGVLRGGQPGERVIALRGDIDALPVKEQSGLPFASTVVDRDYPGGPFPVAHACGHDCHVAMLMGTASILTALRDRLAGTVLFVFQPAEEGPPIAEKGGAREMMAQGALSDPAPSMVFGMHVAPLPKGVIGYCRGNEFAAACLVKIIVNGKQTHGSAPWEGVDPMPAAAAIIGGIGQVYRRLPAHNPVTVTIGHLEDVGRFNIIGEHVTLWGTIRCSVQADMASAQRHLRELVEGSAGAYGCTAQVEYLQNVPPLVNRNEWVDAGLPVFERVAGAGRVVELPPILGYDDVSEFVNRFGGLYVFLGVQDVTLEGDHVVATPGGRGKAINHNPHFYADDATLATGVRLHAHVAVDHLAGRLTAEAA